MSCLPISILKNSIEISSTLYFEHLFYFFLNYESRKYFKTMNSHTSEKRGLFRNVGSGKPAGSKNYKEDWLVQNFENCKYYCKTGFDPLWRAE